MTKHKIPNWEEYKNYQPNSEFLDLIDQYVSSSNGKKKVKILDWGCGRGQQVLYFREQGLEAFGVDVDCSTIDNGKPLIKKIGYEPKILKLIQPSGKTNFPKSYFDIVISNQVFEHIKSIDLFADEIARITKNNGVGLHIFPPYKHFVEAHLKMPLIHWLPKNKIRKLFIYIFLLLKIDPNWNECDALSISAKADH